MISSTDYKTNKMYFNANREHPPFKVYRDPQRSRWKFYRDRQGSRWGCDTLISNLKLLVPSITMDLFPSMLTSLQGSL